MSITSYLYYSDVAGAFNITIGRLRWLAFHSEAATRSHYVRFTVPKRSGGVRTLFAPHEQLSTVQFRGQSTDSRYGIVQFMCYSGG